MKGTLEFSNRKANQRPASDIGIHNSNPRKDLIPSLALSNYPKIPFRADLVNTGLSKNKSPDVLRDFLDGKLTPRQHGPTSSVITNLKSELTNLKQEVNRLAVNPHEPLEFRPKHKHDRTDPIRRISNVQNRECSFNLESRPSAPPQHQTSFQQERSARRDLDKLKSDFSRKQTEISQLQKTVTKLEAQLRDKTKSREDLETEAQVAKNTCRQFKEQADRLREELRVASQKQRSMFHDQRQLLEKLTSLKNSKQQPSSKLTEVVEKLEKQNKQLLSEILAKNEEHKKAVSQLSLQIQEREKKLKQEHQKNIAEISRQYKQSQKQLRQDHKRVLREFSTQRKDLENHLQEQNLKTSLLFDSQKKLSEVNRKQIEKQMIQANRKSLIEMDSQKKQLEKHLRQQNRKIIIEMDFQKKQLEKRLKQENKNTVIGMDNQKKQLEKQIKQLINKVENQRKLHEQTQLQLLRKKQKEISQLKQQMITLQKSIMIKTTEENNLISQKNNFQRLSSIKDESVLSLQKELADLRDSLEVEKSNSKSLLDQIAIKDSIINRLEIDKNSSYKEVQCLQQELMNIKRILEQTKHTNYQIRFSIQQIDQQKLRAEGECRALNTDLERLKNSERIAWQKNRALQLDLAKANSKKKEYIQKNRINQSIQSQKQQIIKRLEQQIQRHKGSMEQLKKVIEELRVLKNQETLAQNQLNKIKKTLQLTQLRNQQLLENLAAKNGLEERLKNSEQCVTMLQNQIEKKNNIERLILDENANIKKRETAAQQELRSAHNQLNQLRLADKHSELLRQQVNSVKNQLHAALSRGLRLDNDLKVLSLSEKTAIELANESKIKLNVLTEEILKLKVQIRKLQNEKESLLMKVRQLESLKHIPAQVSICKPVVSIQQSSSLQEKTLKEQCAYKDNVICELHMKIGKLQTSLQEAEQVHIRLQKTEQLLAETNDLVARLRLKQLEGRLNKYRQL